MTELELIKGFLTTSPIFGVVWILYKTGVLGALASRLKKNGDEGRIGELETFRVEAETNHFHDIEGIKRGQVELWKAIDTIRRDLQNHELKEENRMTRLETKILNGNK